MTTRHFTAAAHDYIRFSPGLMAPSDCGPMSWGAIWRATTNHTGTLSYSESAGPWENNSYICEAGTASMWHQIGGSFRQCDGFAPGAWRFDGWSKADGAGQQVRSHSTVLGSGVWSHTNRGVCGDTGNVPIVNIFVGSKGGSTWLNADVAVIGMASIVWSDAEFEGLLTSVLDWQSLISAAPAGLLFPFNQANVADPVPDMVGTAAQTAISGTSIQVADPPGFSWGMTLAADVVIPAITSTITASVALPAVLPPASHCKIYPNTLSMTATVA